MKIKTRLKIAFCATVLIPLIILSAATVIFGLAKIHAFEKNYGINFSFNYFVNTAPAISEAASDNYEKMSTDASSDPDSFLNFAYLQEQNEQLQDKLSYLLVLKNGKLFYQGSEKDAETLISHLPGAGRDSADYGTYIGGETRVLVRDIPLSFTDGSTGAAYLVTEASAMIPHLRSLLLQMTVGVILVLIATAGVMTYWIYQGIDPPVRRLREATKRITSGDLDFTVETAGKDEISDLCKDFEMMRQRLEISETEKEKYNKETRELISNISHDLKTPITTVKGYVEGIMDGVADTPEKMDRYIKTIYNKANEMDRLINELTFYSKIDTNKIPYHFSRLNVNDFFDDCAEELALDLESNGISFGYSNRVARNVRIIADPEQLKRVVSNIISNSVKYIEREDGKIELRICDEGDFVRVEIQDNGIGIASKDLPFIFDRFYRVDEARSTGKGGSGIGLSIVRKIVEDHGGKIWAESQLGSGTTMCFVIRKYQEVPS
ncbi:MAG: HAMP domain-containing protein [Lachnospiraceae bacterium]|nr:HAMP domain-containing protein [Lachnospiraceae bacterium]